MSPPSRSPTTRAFINVMLSKGYDATSCNGIVPYGPPSKSCFTSFFLTGGWQNSAIWKSPPPQKIFIPSPPKADSLPPPPLPPRPTPPLNKNVRFITQ